MTPYEYIEYPKWVKLPSGKDVIVNNKDEEDAMLGTVETVEQKKRGRPAKS